ncbi:hypothetical protein WM26_18530 [Burkholderia cepacia]|nr:hypothetical protein WM26_18530 [Burkholderia cepacia]
MIRCRQHKAVGGIGFFHECQNRIQHAADFSHIIRITPARSDRIEFVQQIDPTCLSDLIEKQSQLAGRFTEEAAEQSFKTHCEERQAQFTRQG